MPVNDNKPKSPEDIINDIFFNFAKGFPSPETKSEEHVVDSVKEAHRLLKRAEESADNATPVHTNSLLEIADRHIRIIEAALAYQK